MPKGFYILWTIEGVPELSRILMTEYRKVTNFKEPLFKASKLILADVERNFETEGSLAGGWQKLADATVAGRLRAGYGGEHPILQRTGALRRSFYSYLENKKATITSRSLYFKYHQSRKPRKTKLPRRPMLLLTQRTKENIQEEFRKFLRF